MIYVLLDALQVFNFTSLMLKAISLYLTGNKCEGMNFINRSLELYFLYNLDIMKMKYQQIVKIVTG